MKKSLYFILFATLLAQVPSEVMGMKREKEESKEEPAQKRQDQEVTAAAGAPKQEAPQDKQCGICLCDFNSPNEDGHVVKRLILFCCSYPICEKCLEDYLRGKEGKDRVCPQCNELIEDVKILKDELLSGMMKRKTETKRAQIRKEQEEARELEKKRLETARIKEQARKFVSGEDITAYCDVPVDQQVFIGRTYKDGSLVIIMQLPLLHFLANGGVEGNESYDAYKDAYELVKYFVEKGADINQRAKILINRGNEWIPGLGRYNTLDSWCEDQKSLAEQFVFNLTPLEIAEKTGNHSIAEYLRGKIAEQQAAQARQAAEEQAREAGRRAPPEKQCAIQ